MTKGGRLERHSCYNGVTNIQALLVAKPLHWARDTPGGAKMVEVHKIPHCSVASNIEIEDV